MSLLLDQGLEQKEIALRLGVSAGTVSGDVAAIKVEAIRAAVANVERMVAREALALDEDEVTLRTMLGEAETVSGTLKGYETVLMIMRRRAELLGLDAQQRRKQQEVDGATDDLDTLLARVLVEGEGE